LIVLCDNADDEFVNMRKGLASVFEACGFACYLYDPTTKPPLDAFYEIKPSLYLGSAKLFTSGVLKALKKYTTDYYQLEEVKYSFDSINYHQGNFTPSLECDIAYIGKPVPGLLERLDGYKFKLFGPESWEVPQYLGCPTDNKTKADIWASATISLAFTPEEKIHVLGCGGTIADLEKLDYMINYVHTQENYHKTRLAMIKYVNTYSSYFNEVQDLLKNIGFDKEAKVVEEKHSEILGLQ
jgi:hypothetical protein